MSLSSYSWFVIAEIVIVIVGLILDPDDKTWHKIDPLGAIKLIYRFLICFIISTLIIQGIVKVIMWIINK